MGAKIFPLMLYFFRSSFFVKSSKSNGDSQSFIRISVSALNSYENISLTRWKRTQVFWVFGSGCGGRKGRYLESMGIHSGQTGG